MTPAAVQRRQALGALLARGQTLVIRTFDVGLADDHSAPAQALRLEFAKVLRSVAPSDRASIITALENCIAVLQERHSLRGERSPGTIRATEASLHSVLTQASALAAQLDMLDARPAQCAA